MSSRTLVARLQGGTGNQLFQYAAGLDLAEHLDAEISWLRRGATSTPVDDVVGTVLRPATAQLLEKSGKPGYWSGSLPPVALNRRLLRRLAPQVAVRTRRALSISQSSADAFARRATLLPVADHVYMEGYFQHPSYFSATVDRVADQVVHHLHAPTDSGLGADAIVISFRRGDYVPLGWALDLSYYEEALRAVGPSDRPVWVVSDDPVIALSMLDWLKARGWRAEPSPSMGVSPVIRDVRLLMAAGTVIMSNSTLCWWGTTAGDRIVDGRVRSIFAPRPWLHLPGADSLINPRWNVVGRQS